MFSYAHHFVLISQFFSIWKITLFYISRFLVTKKSLSSNIIQAEKNIDCVSVMHSDLLNIILNYMYGSTIA
jgi:hypothetical protein